MMNEPLLMKDRLGKAAVMQIAAALAEAMPGFPQKSFIGDALNGLQQLELKERVRHLIAVMHRHLPADFISAARIMANVEGLAGFAAWPVIDYIGTYGLGHPETSLAALKKLTPMFSAEFAIRPFLIQHFETTYRTLEKWTTDPDAHVRRLVSEGSRPRLPWGQRLPRFIADPAPVFQLLEKLKDDPSDYVRRSVANNLNDISKDHPEAVIACCRRWQENATSERTWIIRHATRTLVKAGHPAVFTLLGFTGKPQVKVSGFNVIPKLIRLGESVEFRFTLQSASSKPQTIVLDYAIHHMKANGKTSPKVFKFTTVELRPGETATLVKRHAIKPITTRRYHSGEHALEILINGQTFGQTPFTLLIGG